MHTYDDNCEFELSNLYDNLDHYYAIHLINWFAATLIMRDRSILHFWSVLDEIIGIISFYQKNYPFNIYYRTSENVGGTIFWLIS